jgi:hypothetical protein
MGVLVIIGTIVMVPILFGIRIGIQDAIRGIGQDRRYARRERQYLDQVRRSAEMDWVRGEAMKHCQATVAAQRDQRPLEPVSAAKRDQSSGPMRAQQQIANYQAFVAAERAAAERARQARRDWEIDQHRQAWAARRQPAERAEPKDPPNKLAADRAEEARKRDELAAIRHIARRSGPNL